MSRRLPATLVVLIVFLTGCGTSSGPEDSTPPEPFTATFGGELYDEGNGVIQTAGGDFLCVGLTESSGAGGYDIWVVKTDDEGNEIWSQTYGGSENDGGRSIHTLDRGGIIVCGYTNSFSQGNSDAWLLKLDAQGDTLWTRSFGGPEYESSNAVLQTQDGGCVFAGYTTSFGAGGYDAWLLKTDANGSEVWSRTFGGSDNEIASDLAPTDDGGFVITGYTRSSGAGSDDLWLIRTDSEGNEIWNSTFGGADQERGNAVMQTSDGGFLVTGITKSFGAGDADLWLIKTDAEGNELWRNDFGGAGYDSGRAVQETGDGEFAIFGNTASFGAGANDIWLILADSQGDSLWTRTFGGTASEQGEDLRLTQDGGFIGIGHTFSIGAGSGDMWLLRMDEFGSTETSE